MSSHSTRHGPVRYWSDNAVSLVCLFDSVVTTGAHSRHVLVVFATLNSSVRHYLPTAFGKGRRRDLDKHLTRQMIERCLAFPSNARRCKLRAGPPGDGSSAATPDAADTFSLRASRRPGRLPKRSSSPRQTTCAAPGRVAVNQVQQHQRRALWAAVAALPLAQRRHRHTEARYELGLSETHPATFTHGRHVNGRRAPGVGRRTPHLHPGLFALRVADGLGQALPDALECLAHALTRAALPRGPARRPPARAAWLR